MPAKERGHPARLKDPGRLARRCLNAPHPAPKMGDLPEFLHYPISGERPPFHESPRRTDLAICEKNYGPETRVSLIKSAVRRIAYRIRGHGNGSIQLPLQHLHHRRGLHRQRK